MSDPNVLVNQSNGILTAIVQGARSEEPSPEVRMAAINALINSLDFIKANFEREVSDDNKNIFGGIC
ncbi:hypothetical protein G6F60_015277 [Rhizopus arrhizus]|nr:hypothetical protein G6F60_015277 [Rhizopus arrhizus]